MVMIGWFIWTVLASMVTFGMYWLDKRAAIKSNRRISERTLLVWSALGGWPGGMLAAKTFRHKTVKVGYRIKFSLAVVFHLIVSSGLYYLFG